MPPKLISQQSIELYEEYKLKYGPNSLVLMQVGSFYEIYAVDFLDKQNKLIKRGPDVKYLEQLLDICIAHKGTNKDIFDYNNPYMLGFPIVAQEGYIEKLLNNGYTVITIIQEGNSKTGEITRRVDNIYSPGTSLMYNKHLSNFIVCIYIEEFKKKNNITNYAIGLSAIDITTGQVLIHEALSKNNDYEYCFDDALRFLNSVNPSEIIIYTKGNNKDNTQEPVPSTQTINQILSDSYQINNLLLSNDDLIKIFLLQDKSYQIKNYVSDYTKINFQRKFLSEVYKYKSMIDIFDALNISDKIYCRNSLVHNLKYIYEHNTNLILSLNEPEFYFKDSNLILGNDALNQLSIINKDDRYYDDAYNINSLLSIINLAGTTMGKRYIKNLFSSPLTDPKKLQKIYNNVEQILKLDFKQINLMLKKISDLERLNRNVLIKCMKYNKIVDYIKSLNSMIDLIDYLEKIKFNEALNDVFINPNNITLLKSFVSYLNTTINTENALNYSSSNIVNIFNPGIYNDIDQIQVQLKDNHEVINLILDKLNELFVDKKMRGKAKPITLKQSKIKGYYYYTTTRRFEYLENVMKDHPIKLKDLTINFNDFVITRKKNVEFYIPFLQDHNKNINDLFVQMDGLIYNHFNEFLDEINNKYQPIIKYFVNKIILLDYYTTIALVSDEFKYTKPIIEKYNNNIENNTVNNQGINQMINNISGKVDETEINQNNEKVNNINNKNDTNQDNKQVLENYAKQEIKQNAKKTKSRRKTGKNQINKPDTNQISNSDSNQDSNPNSINTIKNQINIQTLTDNSPVQSDDFQSKSYVEFIDLRHPIVEQLIKNKYEYIPHSLTIGKGTNGIMLYGLNSAGKSVLMKAIGISIIMAQCGFYVPAKKFKYYPYNALYTRITGTDNIFKGLSSYMLEMTELNCIIKRADDRTLIIGDEICRGTEQISGNIIVASTIIKLLNQKSNFIFATHLHDIMNLEQIKVRNDLKAYHLSVSYKDGQLFYDRQLREGVGDRIYGITIAEYVINDKEFKDIMVNFKKDILDNKITYSKYNLKLIMDKCAVCGAKSSDKNKLITHHINFQKDCENGVVKDKPYINKNDEINLVCICEECHEKVHHGNLVIEGKTYTSDGYKLNYYYK